MPATAARRREAQRQANEIARINRQGNAFVREYTKAIKQAALLAFESGKKLNISEGATKQIVNELVGFSAFAYLTRLKTANKETLSLASTFDARVKSIANGFDIDLGNLRKQLIKTVEPNVKTSLAKVRKGINETLAELSAEKIPTKQAKAILNRRLNEMGVTPANKGYVETLVRTHGQLAWGAAQAVDFESDTDIWGYEYVTVGDDRVREEHEDLDGTIRIKSDAFWKKAFPPNGWNCRCQALAIYEKQRQTPLPKNYNDLIDSAFRFNPGKELV